MLIIIISYSSQYGSKLLIVVCHYIIETVILLSLYLLLKSNLIEFCRKVNNTICLFPDKRYFLFSCHHVIKTFSVQTFVLRRLNDKQSPGIPMTSTAEKCYPAVFPYHFQLFSLFIFLFVYLFIHSFIHLSNHPFIHPMHPPVFPLIHRYCCNSRNPYSLKINKGFSFIISVAPLVHLINRWKNKKKSCYKSKN